jgi:hypothetical protein
MISRGAAITAVAFALFISSVSAQAGLSLTIQQTGGSGPVTHQLTGTPSQGPNSAISQSWVTLSGFPQFSNPFSPDFRVVHVTAISLEGPGGALLSDFGVSFTPNLSSSPITLTLSLVNDDMSQPGSFYVDLSSTLSPLSLSNEGDATFQSTLNGQSNSMVSISGDGPGVVTTTIVERGSSPIYTLSNELVITLDPGERASIHALTSVTPADPPQVHTPEIASIGAWGVVLVMGLVGLRLKRRR